MIIHTPEGLSDRTVTQLYPDHTGKTAVFDPANKDEPWRLPVVGWAVVLHLGYSNGEQPHIQIEPVVDDDDYGPITASDLTFEVYGLKFRRVE